MKIAKLICAGLLALNSISLQAGELHLEYGDFYSHLKKLDDEDLQSLQFAFGFLNVQSKTLCNVTSVLIDTDKQDIDIPVMANQRFVLPSEKALKMAKAQLFIKLVEPQNQCDLSVLLEVKPDLLEQPVTANELRQFQQAFDDFFDKMGGFLAFMMPSPKGMQLTVEAGVNLPVQLEPLLSEDKQVLLLNKELLGQLSDSLEVSGIKQITALMPD